MKGFVGYVRTKVDAIRGKNVGDFLRMGVTAADEFFIEHFGRPILHVSSGKTLRALYTLTRGVIGVDSNDLSVEFAYEPYLKQMGQLPCFDDVFYIPGMPYSMKVMEKSVKDDLIRGQHRILVGLTPVDEAYVGKVEKEDGKQSQST